MSYPSIHDLYRDALKENGKTTRDKGKYYEVSSPFGIKPVKEQ